MTDTIANRSFAVLQTRLPYTDRRSLSQAWFSALHLAQIGPARGLPARRASDAAPAARTTRGPSVPLESERSSVALGASRVTNRVRATIGEGEVRSDARDVRVRSKDKAAFEKARSYPPFSTSLTVGTGGARIKLLLRREGPTLHVIALCAPDNADLVRRALACADTYLRRSGESVRASVQTRVEHAR